VVGEEVHFDVASGGGSLSGTNPVLTDVHGIAAGPDWTLGVTTIVQTMEVSVPRMPALAPVALTATIPAPTLPASAHWTASGPGATVEDLGAESVRLRWNSDAFSASWSYVFSPDTSGPMDLDWVLQACHSWFQSSGLWRIQTEGPSGTQTTTLSSGGGCTRNASGSTSVIVHEGYAVRILISGSHGDSARRLDGRFDLTRQP
jgi:hypothetical protein